MKIDTVVNDDDLIEFLSEQYKQTNNLNFIAAAHAIELYRRNNEILSWQLAQHDWISVSDRLPEQEGWHLVYTTPDKKHKSINKAEFRKGYEWNNFEPYWRGAGGHWGNVTHWRSLPEPPKKE